MLFLKNKKFRKKKLKLLVKFIKKNIFRISITFVFIVYLLFCYFIFIKEYNKPIIQNPLINVAPSWAINLGQRIRTLRQNIPTIDQVILVPDADTFLVAIQDWSLKGRYPILIKDSQYTPLFINSFKPKKVINLPSVKPLNNDQKINLIYQAIANSWGAENYQSLKEKWQELNWIPPGVVITSKSDPAYLGAVALAADRGEPLVFLEEDFGKPNDTLNLKQWQNLQEKVENLVKNTGYSYDQLGDNIDTITLVKNLAIKYQSPYNKQEQLAVTDGLGRDKNDKRWAITGVVYGTSIRSVYMAMCGIFLQQKTAFLYDSYDHNEPWINYQMKTASADLKKENFKTELWQRPKARLKTWLKLIKKPWQYDLIVINSKGNPDFFHVGNKSAYVKDIPNLKVPAILHLIHSWSLAFPDDINTVGGRWLDKGIYAYVGSVNEPYLWAFIPPKYLIKRMKNGVPFLIASRYFDSPPWKIATIGDPLIVMNNKPILRISPSKF